MRNNRIQCDTQNVITLDTISDDERYLFIFVVDQEITFLVVGKGCNLQTGSPAPIRAGGGM